MIISDKISELRKERGMTQEQLGALVGVSSQAVSKWENGGAPDVELLPLIADVLGVSLDGLFGRDEKPETDISHTLVRYLQSFPENRRMKEMFHLLTTSIRGLGIPDALASELDNIINVRNTAYINNIGIIEGESSSWMRPILTSDDGAMLTVSAEDFPLYLLLPEPEGGYGQNLAPVKDYQRLFTLLVQDGVLELLFQFMKRQPDAYISAATLAHESNIPLQDADRLLSGMADCGLLTSIEIEAENGNVMAYQLKNEEALIPFLYLARWLMHKNNVYFYAWKIREKPWLTERKGNLTAQNAPCASAHETRNTRKGKDSVQ
ncbi:MAG: helix-turn-helix transcriptional regulator [Lachnospiraceae bacterium]|nr:helix-turn-helix transcriptional regulator [Lachnospiraceae bacterium]